MVLVSLFICFLHTPHNENINENFNIILINFYLKKFNLHNDLFVVINNNKIKYNSLTLF